MEFQSKSSVELYKFIGKAILVFLSGGIVFHMIVMVIDYFLMIEPFYLNMRENFTGSIFSEPMMPMVGAYGVLSFGIYLLWDKTKKAALVMREKESQKEKAEAILKSMQRLTGIMAEHIASQNSEIVNWIQFRKRLGHPVPTEVELPSIQIGKAIQSMSELTFIVPYTDNSPNNAREFEKILFDKLSRITDVSSEKKLPLENQTAVKNY